MLQPLILGEFRRRGRGAEVLAEAREDEDAAASNSGEFRMKSMGKRRYYNLWSSSRCNKQSLNSILTKSSNRKQIYR